MSGETPRSRDQHQRAIEDYDKAIQLDPNEAVGYAVRALTYHNLGQYQTAIEDYDKAIQLDPNYATAYGGRGLAYRMLGQHADADKAKACSLDSQYC